MLYWWNRMCHASAFCIVTVRHCSPVTHAAYNRDVYRMTDPLKHEQLAEAAASEAEAGSFSKAAQLFQAAMLASPDSSAAAAYSEQLAQCLMELEQDEAAVAAAAAAVRLRPKVNVQLQLLQCSYTQPGPVSIVCLVVKPIHAPDHTELKNREYSVPHSMQTVGLLAFPAAVGGRVAHPGARPAQQPAAAWCRRGLHALPGRRCWLPRRHSWRM